MIASTIPGIAAEVARVDMADRIRAADADRAVNEMKREIRAKRTAARRARRSARPGQPRFRMNPAPRPQAQS